jgi:glycosyltransferase involved in cell wall biosynthesis
VNWKTAAAAGEPPPAWRSGAEEQRCRAPARAGPPHLVHVFPSFGVGGVQIRFATLAGALGDRFRHTVVSLNNDFAAADFVPRDAAVAFAEPPPRAGSPARRLRELHAFIASQHADLLLTHNWGSIEAVIANAFGPTPHIHLEDGFGPEEAHQQLARRVWTRRIALARSQVVVPSRALQVIATTTWGLDPRRVKHIPNGLAPCGGRPAPLADLGLNLPAASPRIVWAGALRSEKNPLRLLRAFACLRARALLLLIGDGPERAAVETEAARLGLGSSVRFLGHRTDSRSIIAQCDLLALSSDTEQMPLVVLEAMDAGLPVVATDVGDIREMLAEENRAYVVPPDVAEFGAALAALVDSPALRTRIGAANRARQRALYGLGPMVEAYRGAFDRALAFARRPA